MTFSDLHNIDEHSGKKEVDLPLFDLATIVDATEDFSMENKLGEGGFGPVYKVIHFNKYSWLDMEISVLSFSADLEDNVFLQGKLADGKEIGVKRLAKTSVQGCDEFKNEVMLIAKLQHRNLVQLVGCCTQGEERMLVYEYMPNKSLDALLFGELAPLSSTFFTFLAIEVSHLRSNSMIRQQIHEANYGNFGWKC